MGYHKFERSQPLKFNTADEIKKLFDEYEYITPTQIQTIKDSKQRILLENERTAQIDIISKIIMDNLDIMTYELLDTICSKGFYWNSTFNNKINIKIHNKEEIKKILEKVKDEKVIYILINNSTEDTMDKEIFQEALKKGYRFNYNTPKYIFEDEQYQEIVTHEKERLYQQEDLKYINFLSPYLVDNTIFRKACHNGYKIDESTPEYIKNNIDYVTIFITCHPRRLKDYVNLSEEQQEKLMFNLINYGYIINTETPIAYRKFKYIKYTLKQRISYLEERSSQEIFDNLSDSEKKEVESIILEALDKEQGITNIPSSLVNFSFVKKLLEKGKIELILNEHPEKYFYVFSEEQKDELVLTAIEHGYGISKFFNQLSKIKVKPSYVEKGFECRQYDILCHSYFYEYIKTLEPETQERLIFKLIDSGYNNSNLPIFDETKYHLRFFKNGILTSHIQMAKLTEEERKQLNDTRQIALENGYQINFSSPEWMRNYDIIKFALENGNIDAINYLDKNTDEQKKEELLKQAIKYGFILEKKSPDWIIEILFKLLQSNDNDIDIDNVFRQYIKNCSEINNNILREYIIIKNIDISETYINNISIYPHDKLLFLDSHQVIDRFLKYLDIEKEQFALYGFGASENWLEIMLKIVNDDKLDEFKKIKEYLFNQYYSINNDIDSIRSLINLLINYSKYPELCLNIINSNDVLSYEIKSNIDFLFSNNGIMSEDIKPTKLEDLFNIKKKYI